MIELRSPYQRLNLVRNPFGELTRSERAELAVCEQLDEWLKLLEAPRAVLQFVGGCGFGKTTRLLALQRALPKSEYIYYPETGPRPALPCTRPLLIDEADRMGWRQRWRMLRGEGPLAIGTHVDLSRCLKRAGFDVTTIDVARRQSPAWLAAVLNRRIEASRLDACMPVPVISERQAERLSNRFDGNLRSIEHSLYERFQRVVERIR